MLLKRLYFSPRTLVVFIWVVGPTNHSLPLLGWKSSLILEEYLTVVLIRDGLDTNIFMLLVGINLAKPCESKTLEFPSQYLPTV
jgi:hypothetical protein